MNEQEEMQYYLGLLDKTDDNNYEYDEFGNEVGWDLD